MTQRSTYHTTLSGADLQGPVTESEFLQALEQSYETGVWFANRTKSTRASNHLSYLAYGWIVAQVTESGVALYDSVQKPEVYMDRIGGRCWVAGRHERDQYWFKIQRAGVL